jgi:ketopantoate reductase
MHVVVLGAGGLGCVIGARLAEVGARVTLIARPAHVEAIERNGLQIGGIRGDSVVRDGLRQVHLCAGDQRGVAIQTRDHADGYVKSKWKWSTTGRKPMRW